MARLLVRKTRPRFAIDFCHCLYGMVPVLAAALAVILWSQVHASEFPDRECCDPVYPAMPQDPEPLPPAVLPTATTSSSQASPIGRSGTTEEEGRLVEGKRF